MYKLLITTTVIDVQGISTFIVEFSTKEEADVAADKVPAKSGGTVYSVIKLY